MSTTIKQLAQRLNNENGELPWVDPATVTGYDVRAAFDMAKQNWFALNDITDVSDTAIEVIPDYLDRSLSEAEWAGRKIVTGERFLTAVIWLVQNLGSSYAVHTLCVWRPILFELSAQAALTKVLQAIEKSSEPFVRDLLRDILWEFLGVGEVCSGWRERLKGVVKPSTLRALECIEQNGYETIDHTGVHVQPEEAQFVSVKARIWKT